MSSDSPGASVETEPLSPALQQALASRAIGTGLGLAYANVDRQLTRFRKDLWESASPGRVVSTWWHFEAGVDILGSLERRVLTVVSGYGSTVNPRIAQQPVGRRAG